MAKPHIDVDRLPAATRDVLENAAGSARLEGVSISDDHRRLAAAFLAGEFDEATYRAKSRELILGEFGLDP
ncbi:MAG TPA: hypothetical protein VFZ68_05435 [Acidimicrobiales bacterium]